MGLFNSTSGNTKADNKTALINNLKLFQLALREGMGFAYACNVSGNDPKQVTEIIQSDEAFMRDCIKLVTGANMDRLTAASEYAENHEWEKADKARQDAKRVRILRLWGSSGTLETATEDDVFDMFCELDGDTDELAVCFAVSKREMKKYVEGHQELIRMMKIMQRQWNDGLDSEGKKRKK